MNNWLLKTNPEGKFFFGDSPTFADIALAPFDERFVVLEHYRQIHVPETAEYSRYNIWREAVRANAAIASTFAPREEIIAAHEVYANGA